jgi:hypothetical protein
MGLSEIQSILDRAGRWHSPTMHQYCRVVCGLLLALQLVWITASCAQGFAFSWPPVTFQHRWGTSFTLARPFE